MNLNNLQVRKLNLPDIRYIYTTYLVKHFPPNELKPLASLSRLYEKGFYCGYGLYHEDTLLSYAFIATVPPSNYYLLNYYAVLPEYRCSGIGGIFLNLIKASFPNARGFYIEVENPDYSDSEKEKEVRLRRIAFYHNHCVEDTLLLSRQFDVEYKLLFLPLGAAPADNILFQELDRIYQIVFAKELQNKKVDLRLSD